MNYDAIIVELLARIQNLEKEVIELKDALASFDRGDDEEKITTADIRDYIEGLKRKAATEGEKVLELRASEIHKSLKLENRYPMVCNAMEQCMSGEDEIIHDTPSGKSSSREIRYKL